jgi:pyruvate dehydrogenase E2 component (dihydrolipoamide acetyltransferase)
MTNIVMPKLSNSMQQGTIISWFKSTGDQVEIGDELLEIETDKSTAPYVAEQAGVLEVLVPVGNTVAVGDPVARISLAGGTGDRKDHQSAVSGQAASMTAGLVDEGAVGEATPPTASQPEAASTASGSATGFTGQMTDIRATPLARRVAESHGVALADVEGSGPLGRITRADVPRRRHRNERPTPC